MESTVEVGVGRERNVGVGCEEDLGGALSLCKTNSYLVRSQGQNKRPRLYQEERISCQIEPE